MLLAQHLQAGTGASASAGPRHSAIAPSQAFLDFPARPPTRDSTSRSLLPLRCARSSRPSQLSQSLKLPQRSIGIGSLHIRFLPRLTNTLLDFPLFAFCQFLLQLCLCSHQSFQPHASDLPRAVPHALKTYRLDAPAAAQRPIGTQLRGTSIITTPQDSSRCLHLPLTTVNLTPFPTPLLPLVRTMVAWSASLQPGHLTNPLSVFPQRMANSSSYSTMRTARTRATSSSLPSPSLRSKWPSWSATPLA